MKGFSISSVVKIRAFSLLFLTAQSVKFLNSLSVTGCCICLTSNNTSVSTRLFPVAGMSAAAVIGPMLASFLGVPAYEAVGIGLISDVLASAVSAYTYKKSGNLDVKNSLPMMISVLIVTVIGNTHAI